MGIMVYSLLWVMQDFDHQQYLGGSLSTLNPEQDKLDCSFDYMTPAKTMKARARTHLSDRSLNNHAAFLWVPVHFLYCRSNVPPRTGFLVSGPFRFLFGPLEESPKASTVNTLNPKSPEAQTQKP